MSYWNIIWLGYINKNVYVYVFVWYRKKYLLKINSFFSIVFSCWLNDNNVTADKNQQDILH